MYTTGKRQVFLWMGVLLSFVAVTSVWAAPTLTVSPSTVAPGGLVTVTVAGGPGTPEDCVVLALGAGPAITINNVGGPANQIQFLMPSAPGTYSFRFFQNCADAKLLTSATVTVGSEPPVVPPPVIVPPVVTPPVVTPPPPPVVVVPKPVLSARSLTVKVTGGPGGKLDWMGLFPVGAPDTAFVDWARMNGTKTTPAIGTTTGIATFALPMTGGPWEIRFLSSDGAGHYVRLAVVSQIELIP